MAIIDKLYRNKLLAQTPSWVKEMSDEELNQTISQMESQNSQAQKQGIASSIGDLGNIFLQKGGLRPMPRAENNENNINEFMIKEMLRQDIRKKDIPIGDTPPGWWRDPGTGKVYKVAMEEIPQPATEQPTAVPPTQVDTSVPEGLWRDPLTNKIIKIPPQTKSNPTPTEALPEGMWRDPVSGKVFKTQKSTAQQKLELEQEDKKRKQEEATQFLKDSVSDTLNTISEVEKGINNFGLFGQLPAMPGTERATWVANIDKLLSKNVIDLMTNMKQASKTGATGFGQLSERELKVLQDASTALKRNLSPQAAQSILNDMKMKLQKISSSNSPTNDGWSDLGNGIRIREKK